MGLLDILAEGLVNRVAVSKAEEHWKNIEYNVIRENITRCTDGMLLYELDWYASMLNSIAMAYKSSAQMKLSGGRTWVTWLKTRYEAENNYLLHVCRSRNVKSRGRLGGVSGDDHSWDLLLSDKDWAREMCVKWQF